MRSAARSSTGSRRPTGGAREEVPTMVKHYVKYALSTLSAAMFAHMA
ncbi:hypothetical protein ACH4D7_30430 [Streptomyces sp. NPDC018063]